MMAPDGIDQLRALHHMVRPGHQARQKLHLAGGEGQALVRNGGQMARGVQRQKAPAQHLPFGHRPAARAFQDGRTRATSSRGLKGLVT